MIRQAAWHRKPRPTFADALAVVRREVWRHRTSQLSADAGDVVNVPRLVVECLAETLCCAA